MSVDIQELRDAIHRLKSAKLLLNQKEIAQKTDYSYITISEILNEKQPLSTKFIKSFARAYDLDPETLELNNQNQINMSVKRKEEQIRADRIIGEKLRKYRVLNKISQREVAQLWKVQPNSISGYEAGAVSIKPEYLELFTQKYQLPSDYFDVDTNYTMPERMEEKMPIVATEANPDIIKYLISRLERAELKIEKAESRFDSGWFGY